MSIKVVSQNLIFTLILQEYVNTGDVELQSSILDLLIVLLQCKVNLNVIDPKHKFLNFIFSQFDYLENGLFR